MNTARAPADLGLADVTARMRRERVATVPASDLARQHLGRPLPNAVLLGGFAALTGMVSLESVTSAIRGTFRGKIAEGNAAAAVAAFAYVTAGLSEACSRATAALTPRRSLSRSAPCSERSRTSSTSCATTASASARWA